MFQVWHYLNSLIMIKLPISQQEYLRFFPLPSPGKTCVLPFDFTSERDLKNFCNISMMQKIMRTRSSIFYHLIEMNTYIQNFLVFNSGHYIYGTGLCNFFFVLLDLIDRIDSYFQRNLLLIGF